MINCEDIQKMLPQRYPFLLVDKILEFDKEKGLRALKNVTYNEEYFRGHFPNAPVMPGVLLIEAMGQAGIIFLNLVNVKSPDQIDQGDIYYLYSVKARFFNTIRPGDQVLIDVVPIKLTKDSGIIKAKATVSGKEMARAEIIGTRQR